MSLAGGGVYDDDEHKKGWQAAVQSDDLAAIAAAKLSSAGAEGGGAWAPDGIVAGGAGGASEAISLLVVEKERVSGGRLVVDGTAYVAPEPAAGGDHLQRLYAALRPTCLLQHCGGSDCAITLSAAPAGMVVPPGCVALDAVQRMNLHVAHNTLYQFELLEPSPPALVDLQLEAAVLPRSMKLWEHLATLHGMSPGPEPQPEPQPEPEPKPQPKRKSVRGVSVESLSPGDGTTFPKKGDKLVMHYTGTLAADGSMFDCSRKKAEPFSFSLGKGQVIRGWDLGVAKLSLGQRAVLRIDAAAGYGARGCEDREGASGTGVIPPDADLVFDVELLDINGKHSVLTLHKCTSMAMLS